MTSEGSHLTPEGRARGSAQIVSDSLEGFIVASGVAGTGAALVATIWGVSVGLVDAQDFRSGISSRSSRLTLSDCVTAERSDPSLNRETLKHRGLSVSRIAPIGAACAAGLAFGFWTGVDEFRSSWREEARFEPTSSTKRALTSRPNSWAQSVTHSFDWKQA